MNKIAALADIHGNLKALETALKIIREEQVDRIFVCGDVVGYGEQPNQCCETVMPPPTTDSLPASFSGSCP